MLTEQDFQAAAIKLNCDVPAIKAVNATEARGKGFLPDGKVKILFEPHIFWKQLVYAGINPNNYTGGKGYDDILYKKWVRGKYGTEGSQHSRLLRAMEINKTAAIKSASWGAFQIMGFNFRACGFSTVEEMVSEFSKDEAQQLNGFINYLKISGMDDELRRHDWAEFASLYNGSGYRGSPYTTTDDYDLILKRWYIYFTQHKSAGI